MLPAASALQAKILSFGAIHSGRTYEATGKVARSTESDVVICLIRDFRLQVTGALRTTNLQATIVWSHA